jgi:hypothetical protein
LLYKPRVLMARPLQLGLRVREHAGELGVRALRRALWSCLGVGRRWLDARR